MLRDDPSAISRMTRGFWVLAAVCVVGVVGYLMTGWSLLDSIYMVVITIFGVGYGEVRNIETPELKVFTMLLIVSGCSALIYILGGFFQLIAEGELNRALGKLRMTKQIKELEGHVIVCGFGRIGRVLAAELKRADVPVVIVDNTESRVSSAADLGYLTLQGDASHDATLQEAGVERARALCSVLPNDAMNVFITLTARNLNKSVLIIARGEDHETEPKLRQAGADRVVLPSAISANQIADMVTRPEVLDYLREGELGGLDSDLQALGLALRTLALDASAQGRDVGALERAAQVSLMVVAIRRQSGEVVERPGLDVELHTGDSVIILAHATDASSLELRFASARRPISYRGATLHR